VRLPSILKNGAFAATALAVMAASSEVPEASATGVGSRSSSRKAREAVAAFDKKVRPLSHPKALEVAFRSYFAYQAEHPNKVEKPYLYFVDYGLSNNTPRGYVLDMKTLQVVEGPFTVAHGRGSAESQQGIPTRFSNRPGSAATSLGLYLAQETYDFNGKSAGGRYRSIGLRLMGVSRGWNDNARERGVVAHGAPYVTATRAGRSEGCPAMQQTRARRLIPMLANGGMVFLFAPEKSWMNDDPWVVASAE
jgi:hypothetical protein